MEDSLKYIEIIVQILGFSVSSITLIFGYRQYTQNQTQKIFDDIYNYYVRNDKLVGMMYKYVYDLDNHKYSKIKPKDYVYVEQLLTTFEYICDLYYGNKINDYNFSYIKDELNYIKNSKAISKFINCDEDLYPALKKYWKESKK